MSERMRAEGGAEGEKESQQTHCRAWSLTWGARPQDLEIVTSTATKSQKLHGLNHPGAPRKHGLLTEPARHPWAPTFGQRVVRRPHDYVLRTWGLQPLTQALRSCSNWIIRLQLFCPHSSPQSLLPGPPFAKAGVCIGFSGLLHMPGGQEMFSFPQAPLKRWTFLGETCSPNSRAFLIS